MLLASGWFELVSGFPASLVPRLAELSGHAPGPIIVMLMQYGKDFSGKTRDE